MCGACVTCGCLFGGLVGCFFYRAVVVDGFQDGVGGGGGEANDASQPRPMHL